MARAAKNATQPKDDPLAVGHHHGDRIWGYDVLTNGDIRLCSDTADRMRRISDAAEGLNQLLHAVQTYVAAEHARLASQRRDWWSALHADLGIDLQQRWTFDAYGGLVRLVPDQPEQEKD